MTNKQPPDNVSIGKFDILATYAYAKALLDGLNDDEAKQRGMVAAIMGAQARLGIRKEHHEEFQAQKEAAEKKKKTTITAQSFDKQVAHKMGRFFEEVFLPNLKKLIEAGLSYEEVKRLVKIPSTWGAKIKGEQFEKRVSAYFSK
ncbi:MAG: hypothetical protein ABSH35_34300 [Isosphaeraceae bacterium]|jgi:hypothetical protein